jgi:hypothetical protein
LLAEASKKAISSSILDPDLPERDTCRSWFPSPLQSIHAFPSSVTAHHSPQPTTRPSMPLLLHHLANCRCVPSRRDILKSD